MTEFIGYPRADGTVGVRNHVLLLGLNQRSVNVCHKVARLVKEPPLVFSWMGDGGVLSKAVGHPNVGASVVVGNRLDEQGAESLLSVLERSDKPQGVVDIGRLGLARAVTKVNQTVSEIIQDASIHRRELVRFSKLLPILFPNHDNLAIEVLVGFLRLLKEEKGRCLWVEKGAKSQDVVHPEIKENLAGHVEIGQAPGADPGVYRYLGPENDNAILRTVLISGGQVVVCPPGLRLFMANTLIPRLIFSAGQEVKQLISEEICDLDFGQEEDRKLSTEDGSLLLFSEVLAIASGKLTRDEISKKKSFT